MRALLAALFLLTATWPGLAQTAPRAIVAADVAALPQAEVSVVFQTGHGPEQRRYAGPLLWAVLASMGLMPPGAAKTRLIHDVVVTGRDGYAVSVAIGEIDPEFEGKSVIVATRQDDHPIGGGELRLIVPGDKHGGRAVHDVVRIDVR